MGATGERFKMIVIPDKIKNSYIFMTVFRKIYKIGRNLARISF